MGRRRGTLLVVAAAAAAALVAATTAQAAPKAPPRVVQELLSATSSQFSGGCDSLGTSTVTFRVSGTSSAPLAGTFDELGTVTIAAGRAVSYRSIFTISGVGFHVIGQRSASAAELAASSAFCGEIVWGHEDGISLQLQADYTAVVTGRYGNGFDTGTTSLIYGDIGSGDVAPGMAPFQFLVMP
jgi:hypothetical protein